MTAAEHGRAHVEVAKDGPRSIVVGYDGSDPARSALAFSVGLARRNRAYLWVCFVGSLPALTGMAAQAAGSTVEALEDEYGDICCEVSSQLADYGLAGQCVRRDGEPAHALESLAQEARADMIVVGRSKSRAHTVLGSVAVHLVKHAGRPVVVVP